MPRKSERACLLDLFSFVYGARRFGSGTSPSDSGHRAVTRARSSIVSSRRVKGRNMVRAVALWPRVHRIRRLSRVSEQTSRPSPSRLLTRARSLSNSPSRRVESVCQNRVTYLVLPRPSRIIMTLVSSPPAHTLNSSYSAVASNPARLVSATHVNLTCVATESAVAPMTDSPAKRLSAQDATAMITRPIPSRHIFSVGISLEYPSCVIEKRFGALVSQLEYG
jgi:hypothetical protein